MILFDEIMYKLRVSRRRRGLPSAQSRANHYDVMNRVTVYDMHDAALMREMINHAKVKLGINLCPRTLRNVTDKARYKIAEKISKKNLFIEY